MSDWKQEAIHHKYDPLPEDGPRHRKKARKRHVRSLHKHEYEDVCVDTHSYILMRGGEKRQYLHVARRCKVCGRVSDTRAMGGLSEPPDGMRLFEVDDVLALLDRVLPDDLEVTRDEL